MFLSNNYVQGLSLGFGWYVSIIISDDFVKINLNTVAADCWAAGGTSQSMTWWTSNIDHGEYLEHLPFSWLSLFM